MCGWHPRNRYDDLMSAKPNTVNGPDALANRTLRKIGWRILPFAMLLYFVSFINALDNLGGFVGPAMIGLSKDWTGSFLDGLYFVAGLLLLSALLTLLLARSVRNKPLAAGPAQA